MDAAGTHNIFSVYTRIPTKEGAMKRRLLGRFITHDGRLVVLEDHSHGALSSALPDGAITPQTERAIESLKHSAYIDVVTDSDVETGKHIDLIPEHDFVPDATTPQTEGAPEVVENADAPQGMPQTVEPGLQRPAPVFDYLRAGMIRPQVLEFHEGQCLMNGQPLSEQEVHRILYNVRTGLATLRYRKQG